MRFHAKFTFATFATFAALAVLVPAGATPDAGASQDVNVKVSVVNNTNTPAVAREQPGGGWTTVYAEGYLSVECGGAAQEVGIDTLRMNCSTTDTESFNVRYNVVGFSGTATIHCDSDDTHFTDDSEVTLTFSGSGAAVTFTQSCTNASSAGTGTG